MAGISRVEKKQTQKKHRRVEEKKKVLQNVKTLKNSYRKRLIELQGASTKRSVHCI